MIPHLFKSDDFKFRAFNESTLAEHCNQLLSERLEKRYLSASDAVSASFNQYPKDAHVIFCTKPMKIDKEPVKKFIEVLVDPNIPNDAFYITDHHGKIIAKVLGVK